jgi:signal transduction histidine kinase
VAATTLRTRLIAAFAYILLAVIVALEVPLALNLNRRALAELEARSLAQTQTIASIVGERQATSAALTSIVQQAARSTEGRVIVVNRLGVLIADSAGPGLLGTTYATVERPELLTALHDGSPASRVARSETLNNQEILATAVPILSAGRPVGAVRITQPTAELRENLGRTLVGVVAIGVGGLAAGLILAIVIAGTLSRPLRRVSSAAARLGAGDLSVRTGTERGSREVEEVAHAFDEMAARLEQLVRAQREFVGNASHQLRTPLTGLKLRLEAASAKSAPDARKDLEAAEREADRLGEIVERLLTLARRVEAGGSIDIDLAAAATAAVTRWSGRAAAERSTLRSSAEPSTARADRADVDQILDNLIENALRYAPGPIVVGSGGSDGAGSFVAVEDRGPGIPAEDRPHVTERFYRGRGAGPGGSGLGLAIVRELAERWGGTVVVEPKTPAGTRIEVRFPAADL